MSVEPCDVTSSDPPTRMQVSAPLELSWEGLHQNVVEKRKLMTSLASHVPNNFTFRTVENSEGCFTRLYFLGIPPKNRENTLLYADIPKFDASKDAAPVLQWRTLFESFQPSIPATQLSREEQLLRERKRLGIFGITSYEIVEKEGKFVFPACNNMYVCMDHDIQVGFIFFQIYRYVNRMHMYVSDLLTSFAIL